MIIKNRKRRQTNLAMAWIYYKKAYDMVPHSWIQMSLKLFKGTYNKDKLITENMKKWNTDITANGESLGNVKIKRGIFQGDSLSPLFFVIAMIPMTLILWKSKNVIFSWKIKTA